MRGYSMQAPNSNPNPQATWCGQKTKGEDGFTLNNPTTMLMKNKREFSMLATFVMI